MRDRASSDVDRMIGIRASGDSDVSGNRVHVPFLEDWAFDIPCKERYYQ